MRNARLGYVIGIGLFAAGLALTLAGLYFGYRYVVGLPIPDLIHVTFKRHPPETKATRSS
ncbi:MAG: hypothetical protein M3R13_01655 [Armatimonadota bacterium]|nr:hypothetical protein [Armatimonadota bacterium]